MNIARTEDRAIYNTTVQDDDDAIVRALHILSMRLKEPGEAMAAPSTVKNYLCLNVATLDHEVFGVLWLDAQNRMLTNTLLFAGTLTQTSVYPREVVKAALTHNAAAAILYHNHPSGMGDPSRADEALTRALKSALALVDVAVLDHMIVAGMTCTSFAERGLL